MSLLDHLRARIEDQGPLSLADYMAACLLHPEFGYYATRDPFGGAGDFITAPEISQMFGELLGLCLAQSWLDQGAPASFVMAEPGPGRGTLMADIWRATRGVPGFHAAAQVVLIEASPHLRAVQADRLSGLPVEWVDSLADLPHAPLWLVANEFFDALPIRQFQRVGDLWREKVVTVQDGTLVPGFARALARPDLDAHVVPDGGIIEICDEVPPIMAQISGRIASHGGAALIVDYGDWGSRGDTFQAVARHEFSDPFEAPGQADLTAHVDFRALTRAALPLRASTLTPQGVLLERLGIVARAQALARGLSGEALDQHLSGLQRLIDPDQMGALFKALALVPQYAPLPPGFETGE